MRLRSLASNAGDRPAFSARFYGSWDADGRLKMYHALVVVNGSIIDTVSAHTPEDLRRQLREYYNIEWPADIETDTKPLDI